MFHEKFWVFKESKYIRQDTCKWKGAKNFNFISWKMAKFCRFECPKRQLFTLFTRASAFFRLLSNFVRLGKFKNGFRVIFLYSWRKSDLKTCITHPKPTILNLTFFDLWPCMTLIWHKVTKGLRGYLEVSQTRSMSFYRLHFNLIRMICPVGVKFRFPIGNRSISLQIAGGPKRSLPIGGQGPGISHRGVG